MSFILTPPNAIGLPVDERGNTPAPTTQALINERWPKIERLLTDEKPGEAISSMEALAEAMRKTTMDDAPLFLDALTLARRILYDDLNLIGQAAHCKDAAIVALSRCAVWDQELRSHLEALILSLRRPCRGPNFLIKV